jgi:magnesium-transporting ATPase (P-type)
MNERHFLGMMKKIEKPYTLSVEELSEKLNDSVKTGLDRSEVKKRLREHGKNKLRGARRKSAWKIFSEQF